MRFNLRKSLPKKWLVGIVALALILSSGTAFALFSSTINFGGINVTVGNSALEIGLPDGTWVSQDWTAGYIFGGLYPGLSQTANFQVKNASTAPISLEVSARLVSAEGDWDDLKDVVTVRVRDAENTRLSTGFKTLAEWSAEDGIKLPGGSIGQHETKSYTLEISIDKDYGNELANKQLHNLHLSVTGTLDD
jgi:hypothetical protein